MTTSASRRKSETSLRITLCAQRLTDERGLDGYTMDELAEAAEVSRRTLFNYFPGKIDAVLGLWPELDDDLVATFVAGGPHHDLVEDLRTLVMDLLETEGVERETLTLSRRVLNSSPRLLAACHERYVDLSATVVGHVEAREGTEFGTHRAQVAVNLLAALLDSSLDQYLVDPDDRPIADLFDESLATARSLLGT